MAETPGRANVPLASRALLALADLAPTSEAQQKSLSIPTEWFTWLPARSVDLFATYATAEVRFAPIPRSLGDRLASVDLLRPEQRSLRVGWLFVAGRTTDDAGRRRRVLHPLVTIPVRVPRAVPWATSRLVPAGDVEISELVTDPLQRRRFEADLQLGGGSLAALEDRSIPVALLARLTRLQAYAREVASAAGLAARRVVTATDGPDKLLRALDELVIVAGVAVYAIQPGPDAVVFGSHERREALAERSPRGSSRRRRTRPVLPGGRLARRGGSPRAGLWSLGTRGRHWATLTSRVAVSTSRADLQASEGVGQFSWWWWARGDSPTAHGADAPTSKDGWVLVSTILDRGACACKREPLHRFACARADGAQFKQRRQMFLSILSN